MGKNNMPCSSVRQKSTQLPNILKAFKQRLEDENKSPNTIRAYVFALKQFFTLHDQADHTSLMLYKCWLIEHYKPQTVNLRIRAVNSYLDFLSSSDFRLPMIRLQQKPYLENVISQADYEYLKRCLLRTGKINYYFAVRLMAATGIRVSELIQTQVIDIRRGYMDIYSKGNRFRRIYIPSALQIPCCKWLDSIGLREGYVFLNRFGNPISASGIRDQLKQFSVRFGLEPAVVHPHSFRHLFAKNFIEQCSDIALLSDILGHENIETTRIYLRRSSAEQQKMFNEIVNW